MPTSTTEAGPRQVRQRDLRCPICQQSRFLSREYLLNTRAATFFNFDWANRAAITYICESCGHILWFLKDHPKTD